MGKEIWLCIIRSQKTVIYVIMFSSAASMLEPLLAGLLCWFELNYHSECFVTYALFNQQMFQIHMDRGSYAIYPFENQTLLIL